MALLYSGTKRPQIDQCFFFSFSKEQTKYNFLHILNNAVDMYITLLYGVIHTVHPV